MCHITFGHFVRMQVIIALIIVVKLSEQHPLTIEDDEVPSTIYRKVPSERMQQWYYQDDSLKASASNSLWDILDLIKQGPTKRHLFISDGWGPGGRPLPIGKSKPNRNKLQMGKEEKKTNKNDLKNQRYYALKWSIPGLFGDF